MLAGSAAAHVVAMPAYLPSKGLGSIALEVPNERDEPMTEFVVTSPPGLTIHHTDSNDGWSDVADEATATWSGGSLAPGMVTTFRVTLEADAEPGPAALEAEQRYADGGVVDWPVSITITPAAESPSQNLALAAVVGLVGILVVAGIVALAWWRRGGSLQER